MPASQAQSERVQSAAESTEPSKNEGAMLIAIGAFVLLVVLILTNMK